MGKIAKKHCENSAVKKSFIKQNEIKSSLWVRQQIETGDIRKFNACETRDIWAVVKIQEENQHLFFWESNIFRRQFDAHTYTQIQQRNKLLWNYLNLNW